MRYFALLLLTSCICPAVVGETEEEKCADYERKYVTNRSCMQPSECYWVRPLADQCANARRQSEARARREAYVSRHPELSEDVRATILKGKFRIGFTADQVRAAVGPPYRINRTGNREGVREQWVYPGGYLYLEDGVLTSWQD